MIEFRLPSGQHVVYDGDHFTFSGSDLTLSRSDLFNLMLQVMERETATMEELGYKLGFEAAAIGQSGGSISADCPCGEGKNPLHAFLNCGQPPHSNKSGGS